MDTVAAADTTPGRLVTMMVGRDSTPTSPSAPPDDIGDVRLAVRGGGNAVLAGIDLEVRAGEIVGIGGLQGRAAPSWCAPCSAPTRSPRGRGRRTSAPPALAAGRHRRRPRVPHRGPQAARASCWASPCATTRCWPAAPAAARGAAAERPRRGPGGGDRATGRQPRAGGAVPLGRQPAEGRAGQVAGARAPGDLLFDEPTRGIDVGAKAAIHDLMRDLARQGRAIVMISSELPELIGLSDRIVVLARGPHRRRAAGRRHRAAGHRAGRRPRRRRGGAGDAEVRGDRRHAHLGCARRHRGRSGGWWSPSTAGRSSPAATVTNILQRSVALGIVAVGQTVAILAGSLDLSVSYLISLSSLVGAETMDGKESMLVPAIAPRWRSAPASAWSTG